MEAKMCSYEEFPASKLSPEGMKVIKADNSPQFAMPQLNIIYSEKDGMPLHLHIIMPPMENEELSEKNKKFPLIVFIQGSGWKEQKLGAKMHMFCEFATRGYVVAIVEYRPSGVAPFPAQIKDAKTAIRFLQEKADDYHIDKNNIFVWGNSSGGHTSVMVAATMEREYNDEDGKLNIKAFIDYYGPTDITKMNDMSPESPEGLLIGKRPVDSSPEWTDAVNPMNHISEEHEIKPLLIIHGDVDRTVPFQQSVLLYEAMKKLDKNVEFYKLEGADHGGDAFWKKSILDLIEDFIKKNM